MNWQVFEVFDKYMVDQMTMFIIRSLLYVNLINLIEVEILKFNKHLRNLLK